MQSLNEMITAMTSDGLLVNNLIFDAQLHRVPTIRKPNQKDGWYVAFSNWKSVLYGDWSTGVEKIYSVQTKAFSRDDALALKKAREAYKKAKLVKQQASANECQAQWQNAHKALTSPYLMRKNIKPYGIRVDKQNNVLVPVLDECGELINLQYINAEGQKRFKAGARVKGGALILGNLTAQTAVLICEGYATGCSLHEATGLPIIVAFNAGNLMEVCSIFKRKNPIIKMLLCADNDHQTERKTGHNTGLEKARDIAKSLNLQVVWPTFEHGDTGSDFNDIHCKFGLEHLRVMLAPVLAGESN